MSLGVASDPSMQRLFSELSAKDKEALVAWYVRKWSSAFPDEPLSVPNNVDGAMQTTTPHPIHCYVPVAGSSIPDRHRHVINMTIEAQLMDSLGYALSSWDRLSMDDPFVASYDDGSKPFDAALFIHLMDNAHEGEKKAPAPPKKSRSRSLDVTRDR